MISTPQEWAEIFSDALTLVTHFLKQQHSKLPIGWQGHTRLPLIDRWIFSYFTLMLIQNILFLPVDVNTMLSNFR